MFTDILLPLSHFNGTVMCLSIGTPKIINFPFVPNVKFIIFRCPKIWQHYSLIIMCSNTGTPKTINFPFGTNGKLTVLGVPILKHFRVNCYSITRPVLTSLLCHLDGL